MMPYKDDDKLLRKFYVYLHRKDRYIFNGCWLMVEDLVEHISGFVQGEFLHWKMFWEWGPNYPTHWPLIECSQEEGNAGWILS